MSGACTQHADCTPLPAQRYKHSHPRTKGNLFGAKTAIFSFFRKAIENLYVGLRTPQQVKKLLLSASRHTQRMPFTTLVPFNAEVLSNRSPLRIFFERKIPTSSTPSYYVNNMVHSLRTYEDRSILHKPAVPPQRRSLEKLSLHGLGNTAMMLFGHPGAPQLVPKGQHSYPNIFCGLIYM